MFRNDWLEETVVLLRGEKVDGHVEIDLDVDKPGRKSGTATYAEIKAYIEENYGFKVSTLYIAQIKANFPHLYHIPETEMKQQEAVVKF